MTLSNIGYMSAAAALLGALAALLQATGYALYLRHALRSETRPNPASWLMFAYGTALVVVLETAAGGTWPVLLLPAVCAASSVVVAAVTFRAGATLRTLDQADQVAFGLDIALTIAYVAVWLARALHLVEPRLFTLAGSFLLVGAAATSITSFVPIVRSTYRVPGGERPGPWIVWTAAYAALGAATLLTADAPALLVYPGVNVLLHSLVAGLSLRRMPASELLR